MRNHCKKVNKLKIKPNSRIENVLTFYNIFTNFYNIFTRMKINYLFYGIVDDCVIYNIL
jgi:hypothetical protein